MNKHVLQLVFCPNSKIHFSYFVVRSSESREERTFMSWSTGHGGMEVV